ncbi:bifunctional diaminohydroxyphosphoribosylaminopyrimidine deaminase/5-amino-6-(5-phosphoribosylamino)uracil reductase RibD [Mesoterricola silvestris]|uniref:Riboflavin biosynthesis protein RibD n=1 Tax=Mesoterricola silvestris TaxID=2927979 RepID=A0AA48GL59_9BACT|nr:bifunctional diaminohydroxyphosphoribosylaminopyrimidine deaminase/5-amino-6-(5-phosphoribosylamino)uracil reductase RibD [Mesoterricola silvestris]BDU71804.1 riboflavin biosynthesis protein RibD [Mesoterricola silvestris]
MEGQGDLIWSAATGGPWPDPGLAGGDARFMALALRAATAGVGLSSPNPPVGCVLERDGRVLGTGVHLQAGGPHAEVLALADALDRGESPAGATAYVTLEPCCHQGRTPPCTAALLRAGVARVVVGVRDPNPRVAGGGIAALRGRGVAVTEGVLGGACAAFHAPFFKFMTRGLPWVTFLLAPREPGPASRRIGLALRRCADAVVIGRRTAEVHDPDLQDGWPAPAPPHRVLRRVVLDPEARLDPFRRAWRPLEGQPSLRATLEVAQVLRGVEDLRPGPGPGGLCLDALLRGLAARGAGRVLFEGGEELARTLMAQGLVDEFHRFRPPGPLEPPYRDPLLRWAGRPRLRVAIPGGNWEILGQYPQLQAGRVS